MLNLFQNRDGVYVPPKVKIEFVVTVEYPVKQIDKFIQTIKRCVNPIVKRFEEGSDILPLELAQTPGSAGPIDLI